MTIFEEQMGADFPGRCPTVHGVSCNLYYQLLSRRVFETSISQVISRIIIEPTYAFRGHNNHYEEYHSHSTNNESDLQNAILGINIKGISFERRIYLNLASIKK